MITAALFSIFSLDQTLAQLVAQYGYWVYAILFAIIFVETGLVIMPFLPGDSLLFVAGAVGASGGLNVHILVLLLCAAAILGDSVNFAATLVGRPCSNRTGMWRLIKKSHLHRTRDFFERHGAFALVIGRFVPIVRTFVPFLAGVGQMKYPRFLSYNIIGGILWITLVVYAGFLFGNIPWVKKHFHWVVIGIVVLSLLPMVIQYLRERRRGPV